MQYHHNKAHQVTAAYILMQMHIYFSKIIVNLCRCGLYLGALQGKFKEMIAKNGGHLKVLVYWPN